MSSKVEIYFFVQLVAAAMGAREKITASPPMRVAVKNEYGDDEAFRHTALPCFLSEGNT